MSVDLATLFEPFVHGKLKLENRIVMAPMTRCFSPKGVPGENVAAYYQRRARNGVGLIITEGTWVPHDGATNDENVPDFFGPAALSEWRRVAEAVHEAGAKIVPQLWHVGLILKPELSNLFDKSAGILPSHIGPSGIAGGMGFTFEQGHRQMSQVDIDAVIDAYASAAESAKALNFDGVEIHAAHGYLIDQFFWDRTNLRTDHYGGNLRDRARFGAEIVAEIRRRTGPEFPILMRISQWKQQDYQAKTAGSPAELEEWLTPLATAGVDLFHCSQRRYWEPEFAGSELNLAGWVKKIIGKPTITVGSVSLQKELIETVHGSSSKREGIDRLIQMLEREEFDLVAVGRGLIADPDWPIKIRERGPVALTPYSSELLTRLY